MISKFWFFFLYHHSDTSFHSKTRFTNVTLMMAHLNFRKNTKIKCFSYFPISTWTKTRRKLAQKSTRSFCEPTVLLKYLKPNWCDVMSFCNIWVCYLERIGTAVMFTEIVKYLSLCLEHVTFIELKWLHRFSSIKSP